MGCGGNWSTNIFSSVRAPDSSVAVWEEEIQWIQLFLFWKWWEESAIPYLAVIHEPWLGKKMTSPVAKKRSNVELSWIAKGRLYKTFCFLWKCYSLHWPNSRWPVKGTKIVILFIRERSIVIKHFFHCHVALWCGHRANSDRPRGAILTAWVLIGFNVVPERTHFLKDKVASKPVQNQVKLSKTLKKME